MSVSRVSLALVSIAAAIAGLSGASRAAERPHVYLVLVDGLGAGRLAEMKQLAELRTAGDCPLTYPRARAVMPTRTNPNHASFATGVYPVEHGITGNRYWDRDLEHGPAGLDAPELLDVETLFTVIETDQPSLRTVGAFGKAKLGHLFSRAPGRQHGPDQLWAPGMRRIGPVGLPTGATRSADATVMDAVLAALDPEPDLVFVSLSGLDVTSHVHGPGSEAAGRALRAADTQVARLIRRLRDEGRLERSVVFVTADHGFADVQPSPGSDGPYLTFGAVLAGHGVTGIRLVSDGGINHVYVEGGGAAEGGLGAAAIDRLEAVRRLAKRTPGVAEALYRVAVPGKAEAAAISARHPSWRVGHARLGEMVLVAEPGVMFSDPPRDDEIGLLGNHGGTGEESIPLVLCGGARYLDTRHDRAKLTEAHPSAADVGATIAALLGLRPPRQLDGRPIEAANRGRVLETVRVP
jgi:hypothetical protein